MSLKYSYKRISFKKIDMDYQDKGIFQQYNLSYMLISWNACRETLRYIGSFYVIPQLKYGINDCTENFFPKNLSRKII